MMPGISTCNKIIWMKKHLLDKVQYMTDTMDPVVLATPIWHHSSEEVRHGVIIRGIVTSQTDPLRPLSLQIRNLSLTVTRTLSWSPYEPNIFATSSAKLWPV